MRWRRPKWYSVVAGLLAAALSIPLHWPEPEQHLMHWGVVVGTDCEWHLLDDFYTVQLKDGRIVRVFATGQPCGGVVPARVIVEEVTHDANTTFNVVSIRSIR